MKQFILSTMVLLTLLYGCTKKTSVKTSEKGIILSGWAFNVETGNPVANTKFTLMGTQGNIDYTANKGKYIFDVKPGIYTLKVEKEGFITEEIKINLAEKKDYTKDFILKKKKKLTPEEKEAQIHLMNAISAFNEGDIKKANDELIIAARSNPDNPMIIEYQTKVNEKVSILVDSLYQIGATLEQDKKYNEAKEIYENILIYEPNNQNVKEKLDTILLKAKPVPKPKPKPKSLVNIESTYKQGLSLFSQGKYKAAISKFKTVLRYKPNHSGARTYKKKAEARLKALGG